MIESDSRKPTPEQRCTRVHFPWPDPIRGPPDAWLSLRQKTVNDFSCVFHADITSGFSSMLTSFWSRIEQCSCAINRRQSAVIPVVYVYNFVDCMASAYVCVSSASKLPGPSSRLVVGDWVSVNVMAVQDDKPVTAVYIALVSESYNSAWMLAFWNGFWFVVSLVLFSLTFLFWLRSAD